MLEAADFHDGAWSTPTSIATDFAVTGGGGLAFLADGRALAVFREFAGGGVRSALWSSGAWGTSAVLATATGNASLPMSSPAGALVGTTPPDHGGTVAVRELDLASTTWGAAAGTTPAGADYFNRPAVAAGASEAIALGSDLYAYTFARRVGTTWTGGNVPGITPPSPMGAAFGRSLAAVALPGTDHFLVALAGTGGHVVAFDYDAGTWSSPTDVASDLATVGSRQILVMTVLDDGRVALAYVTATDGAAIAIHDTSGWGAARVVAGASPRVAPASIAIAPGIEPGVALELVVVNGGSAEHRRLTDVAAWTWTAPVAITGTGDWAGAWIAASP
jgi:hypothetical protein